jgi:hypothetical protein
VRLHSVNISINGIAHYPTFFFNPKKYGTGTGTGIYSRFFADMEQKRS